MLCISRGHSQQLTTYHALCNRYDEIDDPGYDFEDACFKKGTGHFTQVSRNVNYCSCMSSVLPSMCVVSVHSVSLILRTVRALLLVTWAGGFVDQHGTVS